MVISHLFTLFLMFLTFIFNNFLNKLLIFLSAFSFHFVILDIFHLTLCLDVAFQKII